MRNVQCVPHCVDWALPQSGHIVWDCVVKSQVQRLCQTVTRRVYAIYDN